MSAAISLTDRMSPTDVAIGVDIGGTKTKAIAYNARGPISESKVATVPGLPGILRALHQVVTRVAENSGVELHSVRSIGIGIPGIVDTRTGTVSHGVNVGLAESEVPLGAETEHAFQVPVAVVNDATAATLGAAFAAGDVGDAALISIGTGLAAGFVLNGEARLGFTASAGEIGHIPYIVNGLPCRCGQRGCLELYASGRALDRLWPVPAGKKAGVCLFEEAGRGNHNAMWARDEWIGAIAHAVTLVGLTLDVSAILIGGGVSDIGSPFHDALAEELRTRAKGSAFLTHMNLADRTALVPREIDVGSLGACLAGIKATT